MQTNESPFEDALQSNGAASGQERIDIEECSTTHREEYHNPDSPPQKDEGVTDLTSPRLLKQRKLWKRVEVHSATVSPIHRVPDEILREVFLRCLHSNHNATISVDNAPLLLTHICSRWRHVAITTPRLWATIHIPLPSSSLSGLPLADEWISRTGNIPLSVSFSSMEDPSDSTLPTLKSWYERLAPIRKERLESVEIALQADTEEDIVAFVEERRQSGHDLLSHVSRAAIHVYIGESSFIFDSSSVLKSLAPFDHGHLRELEFTCNFHILDSIDTSIHQPFWENLTLLDLQSRNVGRPCKRVVRNGLLLEILSACKNLEVLKAFASGTTNPPQLPGSPVSTLKVVNGRLRHVSLALFNLSGLSTVDLIAQCDWPSLSSFHLVSLSENDGMRESSYVLERLLTKYGQALTSFRISYRHLPPRHLMELISLLPNLVQLHIDNGSAGGWCKAVEFEDDDAWSNGDADEGEDKDEGGSESCGGDSFFESLTPKADGGSQYSCPFLQYLRWEGHTPFSDAALKNFLLRRSIPSLSPIRIEQAVVKFDRNMQEDVRLACAQLIDDGLKLRLLYRSDHQHEKLRAVSNAYRDLHIHEDVLVLGWE